MAPSPLHENRPTHSRWLRALMSHTDPGPESGRLTQAAAAVARQDSDMGLMVLVAARPDLSPRDRDVVKSCPDVHVVTEFLSRDDVTVEEALELLRSRTRMKDLITISREIPTSRAAHEAFMILLRETRSVPLAREMSGWHAVDPETTMTLVQVLTPDWAQHQSSVSAGVCRHVRRLMESIDAPTFLPRLLQERDPVPFSVLAELPDAAAQADPQSQILLADRMTGPEEEEKMRVWLPTVAPSIVDWIAVTDVPQVLVRWRAWVTTAAGAQSDQDAVSDIRQVLEQRSAAVSVPDAGDLDPAAFLPQVPAGSWAHLVKESTNTMLVQEVVREVQDKGSDDTDLLQALMLHPLVRGDQLPGLVAQAAESLSGWEVVTTIQARLADGPLASAAELSAVASALIEAAPSDATIAGVLSWHADPGSAAEELLATCPEDLPQFQVARYAEAIAELCDAELLAKIPAAWLRDLGGALYQCGPQFPRMLARLLTDRLGVNPQAWTMFGMFVDTAPGTVGDVLHAVETVCPADTSLSVSPSG